MYVLLGDPGYPGPPGLRRESGQKGNHNNTVMMSLLYFCVGVKGDTREPGARGPRGIVGKAHINHLYNDIIYQHNSCTRKQPASEYVKPIIILLTTILLLLSETKLVT